MTEKDLTKMSSEKLVDALIADNSLASEFDHLNLWSKFYSWNWLDLLQRHPQFADKCNWSKIRTNKYDTYSEEEHWKEEYGEDYGYILKNLLLQHPQLAEYFTDILWDGFNPSHWCNLLSVQPQFADKCNWSRMIANNYDEYGEDEYYDFCEWKEEYGKNYSEMWKELLLKQPQLAEYFTDVLWDGFSREQWDELLSAQPQFADKCTEYKGWEKFYSGDWCNLLSVQPQFADKCNWTEMRANNYDKYDEDEYDDFEYWKAECGEDYSEDWKNLLLQQPQLAEYFTEGLWDEFSQKQWAKLEAKYPGVFEDKHMLSTLRKLARDD